MFERETRRVKLLEGRIREIKLKMAEDKKHEKEVVEEGEEEIEEEERSETAVDVVPEIPMPMPVIEGEEEGGEEEEEGDIELMEVRVKFFEIITVEDEKRRVKRDYTLLGKTAFDPNFSFEDIDLTKYKTTTSPKIDDEKQRLADLKAIIEKRKKEGEPIDVRGVATSRLSTLTPANKNLSTEEPTTEDTQGTEQSKGAGDG